MTSRDFGATGAELSFGEHRPDGYECRACAVVMPVSSYGTYTDPRTQKSRRRRTCNECRRNAEALRYASDPCIRDRRKAAARQHRLMTSYGLTTGGAQSLRASHGDKCAICGGIGRLSIDHDHATGSVRGMLCTNCNFGIGNFRDSTTVLASAITYLEADAFVRWLRGFMSDATNVADPSAVIELRARLDRVTSHLSREVVAGAVAEVAQRYPVRVGQSTGEVVP